jgi:hypothetical protein
MIQREVADSFALALSLALTGIGRPPRQRWPLPRLRRSGRAGGTPPKRLEREARPGSGRYAAGAEHSRPGDA